MAKRTSPVQWQILLDDDQWDADAPTVPVAGDEELRRPVRWPRLGLRMALVFVIGGVLAAGGFWLRAQQELAAVKQGVEAALAQEAAARHAGDRAALAATLDWSADPAWQTFVLDRLLADSSAPPAHQVERVEVRRDRALVTVRFTAPDRLLPWRETRFYRETSEGWLRSEPVVSFWGEEETIVGDAFTFRFYARDADVVEPAARAVEAEYARLRRILGLPPVRGQRTVVIQPAVWRRTFDYHEAALLLPSPQLWPLPERVEPEQALVQAVLLYFINELVSESFDRYGYGDYWIWSNLTEAGLRNWLVLESQGALVTPDRQLISWLREDVGQEQVSLPPSIAQDCQLLQALAVDVLLYPCSRSTWVLYADAPSVHLLADLHTVYEYDATRDASLADISSGPRWRRETHQELLGMATVYAYAFATYGSERFPGFLAALGRQRTWEDVLWAAFEETPVHFQAGWLAWLSPM